MKLQASTKQQGTLYSYLTYITEQICSIYIPNKVHVANMLYVHVAQYFAYIYTKIQLTATSTSPVIREQIWLPHS